MGQLYEKYVWEVPVRVTHWMNVISIVVLSATGFLIGNPLTLGSAPSDFVMGWIRFVHFTSGYVFAISVLSRIYWMFKGNSYAGWREFVPWLTSNGRRDMIRTFRYYTFLDRNVPCPIGHNTLAGTTYSVVFLLYILMMLTGFSLYSEQAPYGVMHKSLGWMFMLFNNQDIRLAHHVTMWLLIGFAIHHVYSAWLMDIKERGGVMSGIFGGYKPVRGRD